MYGTYVFRWVEINGECGDSAEVTIDFNEEPVADAGSRQDLCGTLTATLAASAYGYQASSEHAGSTTQWKYVSGPDTSPSFDASTTEDSDVTVTLYGTYVFRWVEINGECGDSAEVTIDFNEEPVADAGSRQDLCGTLTATLAASAYGYQASSEHAGSTTQWKYVSGPDTSPSFDASTTEDSDVTVTLYGTYVFRWVEINGECGDSAEVTIDFNEEPVADAGSRQDLCGTLTATLAASAYGYQASSEHAGSTTQWKYVSGPDTSPSFDASTTEDSDVTVTLYGTYVFRWVEINGECGDSAEVTIDFNEEPVADAGSRQDLCGTLTATLAASAYGYQASSEHAGSTAASFPDPTLTILQ